MAARRSARAASIRSASPTRPASRARAATTSRPRRTTTRSSRRPSSKRASLAGLFAMPAGDLRFALTLGQPRQRVRVRSGSVAREPGHHRHAADVPGGRLDEREGSRARVPRAAAGGQALRATRWNSTSASAAPTTTSRAASRPTRPTACGSRSTASRSAAASSTPFARRTSASSTTRCGAQAQIGSPPGQGDPCDVRSTARTGANGAQRSHAVRRDRRSGRDRRHLSVHDRRDRRHQQRQHGPDAGRGGHDHVRLRVPAASSTRRCSRTCRCRWTTTTSTSPT